MFDILMISLLSSYPMYGLILLAKIKQGIKYMLFNHPLKLSNVVFL